MKIFDIATEVQENFMHFSQNTKKYEITLYQTAYKKHKDRTPQHFSNNTKHSF